MKSLQLSLDHLPPSINRIYLAFSGGIDSMVLLHALQDYKSRYQIVLWHINHGLQDNARQMQSFAEQQARHYGLEFRANQLELNPQAGNLEATARHQRYDLFARALTESDVLMTAHHMNDQAETLLLNMMRGSGPAGLSAIADHKTLGKGRLLRPLLDFTRAQIEQYAEQHQLTWIDDPSNRDLGFDRNYLRHQVIPQLLERWPAALQQLHRVSRLQQESAELQQDLARQDLRLAAVERPFSFYSCLSCQALTTISEARQKNLIRYWLLQSNGASIGFDKMHELLKQLNGRRDALPLVQGKQFQVRSYQQALYLVPTLSEIELNPVYDFADRDELEIPAIGLRQSRAQLFAYLGRADQKQPVSLRFRRRAGNPPSAYQHRLKRLFQKHRVPPWLRARIPQIYLDEELVELWLF